MKLSNACTYGCHNVAHTCTHGCKKRKDKRQLHSLIQFMGFVMSQNWIFYIMNNIYFNVNLKFLFFSFPPLIFLSHFFSFFHFQLQDLMGSTWIVFCIIWKRNFGVFFYFNCHEKCELDEDLYTKSDIWPLSKGKIFRFNLIFFLDGFPFVCLLRIVDRYEGLDATDIFSLPGNSHCATSCILIPPKSWKKI